MTPRISGAHVEFSASCLAFGRLYFLGVDVSKAKLDVALSLPNEKFKSKVFANDNQAFKNLLQWLQLNAPGGLAEVHVCMEATGSYHEGLACFLHDQGVVLSVVNPLLVKRFAESNGVRNKTDGGDAKCLAMFCRDNKPARWEAPSPGVRALQALVARLNTLFELLRRNRPVPQSLLRAWYPKGEHGVNRAGYPSAQRVQVEGAGGRSWPAAGDMEAAGHLVATASLRRQPVQATKA